MMPAVNALPPAAPPGAPAAARLPAAAPPAAAPHAVVRTTRVLAAGALIGLIGLGLAWELWLAPTGQRWLALKVLPLVLPLPGLLKRRLYTYRWVSLLVWLYFTEGIVRATGVPAGVDAHLDVALAWGQVALCVLLFTACTVHVRWRLKHPQPAQETSA